MRVHIGHGRLEQLGHLPLGKPDRAGFEADLDAGAAVLGLVEQEFAASRRGEQVSGHAVTSRSIATISASRALMSASMASSGRGGS